MTEAGLRACVRSVRQHLETTISRRESMDNLVLAELGETERSLLAIFVRYGRDGRALTTQSLAANAGLPADSKRLPTALNNLVVRGLIKRAGGDPLPGSPIAF